MMRLPHCVRWFLALCVFNMLLLALFLSFREGGLIVLLLLGMIGGIFWRSFNSMLPQQGPLPNLPHPSDHTDYTYYNR